MNGRASGTFDVRMQPCVSDVGRDPGLGRTMLDKDYRGDLTASSQGEMLSVMGGVEGSAGYVALERVSGSLGDRHGSFALQHFGLMDKGRPSLRIEVVPDSGTGLLTGLLGTLEIAIQGKDHSYVFDYSLPD